MPPKEWPTTASTGPCAAATARRQRITCGMLVVLPGLSPCAGASKARQRRPAPVNALIIPPRWVARDPQPWTSSTGGRDEPASGLRSEARRVGKECVSTRRSRGEPPHKKNKQLVMTQQKRNHN